MGQKVNDLRSALELLKSMPGQYAETEVEVDPRAELPAYTVTSAREVRSCAPQRKDLPWYLTG